MHINRTVHSCAENKSRDAPRNIQKSLRPACIINYQFLAFIAHVKNFSYETESMWQMDCHSAISLEPPSGVYSEEKFPAFIILSAISAKTGMARNTSVCYASDKKCSNRMLSLNARLCFDGGQSGNCFFYSIIICS